MAGWLKSIGEMLTGRVDVGTSLIPTLEVAAEPVSGPRTFDELVGQARARRALGVKLDAYRFTGTVPSHLLFTGGSGLGKTATARVFALAMDTTMHYVMCPELRSWDAIATVLRLIRAGDVLFLDEVHALRPAFQEKLYRVLTDFRAASADGDLDVERFVAVGATTHAGRLNKALKSRLAHEITFEPYSAPELAEIATRHARREYGVELDHEVSLSLAYLCKREARRAVALTDALLEAASSLLRRRPSGAEVGLQALALMVECANIDPYLGLDSPSRRYLHSLHALGRPASAETMAKLVGEEVDNVKYHIEPFLMCGHPERGGPLVEIAAPYGRRLTSAGVDYVRLNPEKEGSIV
jgi:Holliday junction DNA helicase RuvB